MRSFRLVVPIALAVLGACDHTALHGPRDLAPAPGTSAHRAPAPGSPHARVDSRPPPMARPVPLWEHGRVVRQIDAATAEQRDVVVLDLGEEWTPYIFTERGRADEEPKHNTYRATYLALARGEFPDDLHGERARKDKYLELFGILPTLGLSRTRMRAARDLACAASLDLEPLRRFDGFLSYQGVSEARSLTQSFATLEVRATRVAERLGVHDIAAIDRTQLQDDEADLLRRYDRAAPKVLAVRAAQDRLRCEGFLRSRRFLRGGIDWITRDALAEFERRHRVFGWGFVGGDTLDVLRMTPLEAEREAVIRMLTERAIHAAGVIEDGSTSRRGGEDGEARTYRGADGRDHEIPNLEAQVRTAVIDAFGLLTVDSTLAWLESLGELAPDAEHVVAFQGPALPEYYSGDMDLSVVIDRGDVWYDFPYNDEGREQPQPVDRRPRLTLSVNYNGQRIPLARYGTTIGGWRSEYIEDREWWKYKGSPTGPVIWTAITAAPVWIPPESTPPRDLLERVPGRSGAAGWRVKYHEVGPSYASAYGLVAAYHTTYQRRDDGTIRLLGDEGIRTHGSVDYMSIMRRHSHGCHRLHNHIAVRLMSFVLAHRPHQRIGEEPVAFSRTLDYQGHQYELELHESGYTFRLDRPIQANVLEGRVRGHARQPITIAIPKYDTTYRAYLLPTGQAVLFRDGQLVPAPVQPCPNGLVGCVPPPPAVVAPATATPVAPPVPGTAPVVPRPAALPTAPVPVVPRP